MKVIFLDIDGVMNNESLRMSEGMDSIGDEFLERLQEIVHATGAVIVLSSTWRLWPKSRRMVEFRLGQFDMEFIDCTVEFVPGRDRIEWVARHIEIKEWLIRHSVSKFAIIDDDPDAEIEGSFFQTDDDVGLTDEIASQVIEHLGRTNASI